MPPVTPTYPGVYIEEIASGTRTIVGVQTSITAFVGRTPTGPIDEPMTCFNYADFERFFGGRSYKYPLTYAIEDFFLNGGSQAVVVRTFHRDPANMPADCTAKFDLADGLPIWAIGPGSWGNQLTVSFDYLGLRAPGAKPATSGLTVAVTGTVAADEAVAFTLTPPTGSTAQPVTFTVKTVAGDTALAVAQRLAAAVNAAGAGAFASAKAAPGADAAHATITLTTASTDASANTTYTVVPAAAATGAAVALTADGAFAGAAPAKSVPASATLAVGGAKGQAGTLAYQLAVPNAAAISVSVPVAATDDPKTVAGNLAAEISRKLAGRGGQLKPVTIGSDGVTLTLTAATAGTSENSLELTRTSEPPSGGITGPDTVTLAGGVDNGWDLSLAQAAVAPYEHYGVTADSLFNMTVTYNPKGKTAVTERYTNLTVLGDETPNRIDRVVNALSLLVAVNPPDVPDRQTSGFTPYTNISIANPGVTPPTLPASGGVDSQPLTPSDFLGDELTRTAMYALEEVDLFNLLCIPPDQRADDASAPDGADGSAQDPAVYAEAAEFCAKKRAMLICDPPRTWSEHASQGVYNLITPLDVGVTTEDGGRNSAVYFPYIKKADLELNGKTELFAPSGSVAGQFAQTDATRGVWKAPAGMDTTLEGVTALDVNMTDDQNGLLNPYGINAIRYFPIIGPVIWGARTLRGADVFSDDYKYVPVRRLTLYIEESLYRGTKWAVFEPNDDALWSQLRLSVGTFMADLARQGAFYGYSVTCDKTTTLDSDIQQGIVNVVVAFAPVKPAEFVVLKIAQLAGQTPG
jgi:hypothetical protein